MFNASDLTPLSEAMQEGQLTAAMQEAAAFPGKRVYQTDMGLRAFTDQEARTTSSARRVGLSTLTRVLSNNQGHLHPAIVKDYTEALRIFAKVLGVSLNLDVEELKNTAETEGYGYKKANLDQVSKLCLEGFGTYHLKVPEYAGISSDAVQALLKSCDFDLAAKWQEIIERHFSDPQVREEVLRSKKYPNDFLTDCTRFRQEITKAFSKLRLDENSLGKLFDREDIDHLLNKVNGQNERLMIRSTGREDSNELANAGGNTSVPNVTATSQAALQAIAEVVTSYFGEKSLKQRVGAGDPSLFDVQPLTPVLLQRMIGERDPNALPKCGVMFTEDAESALGANERSGITVIESAYGHNEGVVNSLIPVDSYYVNDKHTIMPIIRPKTYRMMPTENSGELKLVANRPEVAGTPSLSVEAIATLKNFAERLEQFYRGPMDVEFVVDESENTIYIVQARPIVKREGGASASYIPDTNKLESADVIQGSAIGTAGGGVRLAKTSEIIAAPNISKALDQYQDCNDTLTIQSVIVGQHAPSTSHWATIFRGEGKPVIHVNDFEKVQSWQENPDAQILISPQQGLLIDLKSDEQLTLEGLLSSGICAKGWIQYPAPAQFSLSEQFKPSDRLSDIAIRQLCPSLLNQDKWLDFQQHASKFAFNKVFEGLRNSQGEELQIHLAVLLYQLKRALERYSDTLILDSDQQKNVEALKGYALALTKSIKDNGDYEPTDSNYPRKLLPIHFLHALIYSQPSSDEVVDGHSIATVALREMAAEQALVRQLAEQNITLKSPHSLSLLRLGKVALTPEIAQQYRAFIIKLDQAKDEDAIQNLSRLVIELNKLDLLSPWLNLTFPKTHDVRELVATFEKQAPFFQLLSEKREILKALNISAFSDAKAFRRQWQIFNSELLNYVLNPDFAKTYRAADISGKFAALAFMNKLVDQFDLAIKELEGSKEFPQQQHLELYRSMLQGYHKLGRSWLDSFGISNNLIASRLNYANTVINKATLSPEDLKFSPDFDVLAFGSRSGAVLGRVMDPVTLEDAFSVTHQELLTILSVLTQQASEAGIPLPALLKSTSKELFPHLTPTGLELNTKAVTLHYTRSLREHGVQYRLSSPIGSDNFSLAVRFSAKNESSRWDKIAHYMIGLKVLGTFDLADIALTSRGLEFTFRLDDTDDLQSLEKLLSTVERASSEIASQGGVKYLDPTEVENEAKQLTGMSALPKILQEFERTCGIKSMLECGPVTDALFDLVQNDPDFVVSFLKRAWSIDTLTFNGDSLVNSTLPKCLVEQGFALNTISARGVQMARSKYNKKEGIRLLKLVAAKDPKAIPDGAMQPVFDFLLHVESRKFSWGDESKNALEALDILMLRGSDEEIIDQGIVALLTSPRQDVRGHGITALDMLLKHRDRYSEALFEALQRKIQDSSIDQVIKQPILDKLDL